MPGVADRPAFLCHLPSLLVPCARWRRLAGGAQRTLAPAASSAAHLAGRALTLIVEEVGSPIRSA